MDPAWVSKTKRQDVVASRADCEDDIVGCRPQDAVVCNIIFPGESVDVRVVEAGVFRKGRVVVDTPVVVLIPCSRQRK